MNDIIIVIPSLNPDQKLINTVNGLKEAGFNRILLVDDGSDEAHKEPFKTIVSENPDITLLTHEVNKGKGAAMKYAFSYIYENCDDVCGVITVDGDGQHLPVDVKKIYDSMKAHPDDVLLGCRDFSGDDVPKKSRIGNYTIRFIIKLLFRVSVSDSQTGLRGIPYRYLKSFATLIEGDRYEYETLMFPHIKERGINIREEIITTVYENNNEGSHYHPVKDTMRIAKVVFMNATFLKQIISSILSTAVDLLLFTLFNSLFKDHPVWLTVMIATAVARVCSSTLNFNLNRFFVFRSHKGIGKSFIKFVALVICQMAMSWGIVTGLTLLTGAQGGLRTVIKLVTDSSLFIGSYFIQKKWVF